MASSIREPNPYELVRPSERERATAAQKARAQREAERALAARRLHDGVGQPLTGLLMEVDRSREEGTASLMVLARIEAFARTALDNARHMVLETAGLEEDRDPLEAARDYAASTLAISGCELVWETPEFKDLPVETADVLAAVIRESVTNIARHAGATNTIVRLAREGIRVVVTVEDDGVGPRFDDQGRAIAAGYGLRANRELAESLGGSFAIASRYGGGTLVRFDALLGRPD